MDVGTSHLNANITRPTSLPQGIKLSTATQSVPERRTSLNTPTAVSNQSEPATLESETIKLFATTKRLLASLSSWSNGETSDTAVSDNYVSLVSHYYTIADYMEEGGVDMSDLKNVPEILREQLEAALSGPPSPTTIEKHLSPIKVNILKLLGGLRKRQPLYSAACKSPPSSVPNAVGSVAADNDRTPLEKLAPEPPTGAKEGKADEERIHTSISGSAIIRESQLQSLDVSPSPLGFSRSAVEDSVDLPSQESHREPSCVPLPSPPRLESTVIGSINHSTTISRRPTTRRKSYGRSSHLPPEVNVGKGASQSITRSDFIGDHTTDVRGKVDFPANVYISQLFLQVHTDIKRTSFSGPLSLSSLKMLFVEKFQYSPGQDDFPEIYVKDSTTGTFYELENLAEISENSHLKLKTEDSVEQITRRMEHSVATLNKEVRDLKKMVMDNNDAVRRSTAANATALFGSQNSLQSLVKRVVSQQSSTTSPIAATMQSPMIHSASELQDSTKAETRKLKLESALHEVQVVRRELGVVRQHAATFTDETKAELQTLAKRILTFKAGMTLSGDMAKGYVEIGKQKMDTSITDLTNRMREFRTTIENLRADVVVRRSRPCPQQMRLIAKENAALRKDIDALLEFTEETRPVWKKTWEDELHKILQEQNFLRDREVLMEDLDDDQLGLSEILLQLGQVVALQGNRKPGTAKTPLPLFGSSFGVASEEGHEGLPTVLREIAGVSPDSDRRLKAMEDAERLRKKKLESKMDEFERELSSFVGDNKLKKTGGPEEVERARRKKTELMLKTLSLRSEETLM